MEYHGEDALFDQGRIQGRLPIGDGRRIVCALEMKGLPIAGRRRWKFPAQPADDIGKGIVLNGRVEAGKRNILLELVPSIGVRNQLGRQQGVLF